MAKLIIIFALKLWGTPDKLKLRFIAEKKYQALLQEHPGIPIYLSPRAIQMEAEYFIFYVKVNLKLFLKCKAETLDEHVYFFNEIVPFSVLKKFLGVGKEDHIINRYGGKKKKEKKKKKKNELGDATEKEKGTG